MKQNCFILQVFSLYLHKKICCTMRMITIVKNQIREIEDYVKEHGIDKKDIVNIFQNNESEYILIYYGE